MPFKFVVDTATIADTFVAYYTGDQGQGCDVIVNVSADLINVDNVEQAQTIYDGAVQAVASYLAGVTTNVLHSTNTITID